MTYFKDVAHSWQLLSDGTYQPMGKLGKGFLTTGQFFGISHARSQA